MMSNSPAVAEYERAKISIWWDIENCPVPKGFNAHVISQNITSALVKLNYRGPLTISSYGNTELIPKSVQIALSSTGIALNHVPSGRKDASDKKILVDMFLWVLENPAPANLMLISGDGDFSDALHRLKMKRYNILLAHPQQASPSLVASTKTTWLWTSLLEGCSSLIHCESSPLVDTDSEVINGTVYEQILSRQPMDLGSASSRVAGNKLSGIYVSEPSTQLLQQETRSKKLIMNCSETSKSACQCKVCNVTCKSFESLTMHHSGKEYVAQWVPKQNLALSDVPENMAGAPSDCHEKDVKMKNKMADSGVEATAHCGLCNEELEPSQNEVVIENLEGVLKQDLEMKSGEPKDAPAELNEHLKEDMSKKKKKKKKSTVIEDGAETYVCSICSVICNHPAVFVSHLKGRKHAATIRKHTEALLDVEEIIRDNGHSTEELWCLPGDASENIDCFEKQYKEMRDESDSSESSVELLCLTVEVVENENKYFPNAESMFTEQSPHEVSSPKEARECFDAIVKKEERSRDETLTRELDTIPNQNLERNSGDGQSNSEEYMNNKKKGMGIIDKAEGEAYVCTICSVICDCPMVFESHLMGRRHSAKIKKHEVLYDDKKVLEESLKEKDNPRDGLRYQSEEAQESIKQVFPGENESEAVLKAEPAITKGNLEYVEPTEERNKEGLESLKLSQEENTSKEKGSEDEKKSKIRFCKWCNVRSASQIDFDSHLAGKKHAARVKTYGASVTKKVETYVKKMDPARYTRSNEHTHTWRKVQNNINKFPNAEPCVEPTEERNREGLERLKLSLEEDTSEEKGSEDEKKSKIRVCNLCNVRSPSQIDFDSHLAGKKHAAKVKKCVRNREGLKLSLEEDTSKEKGSEDAKKSKIRVCNWCNVRSPSQIDFDSHLAGKKHAARVKNCVRNREGLEILKHSLEEDTSCEDEKKACEIRVCKWCNVRSASQIDFDSHLAGKKHAAKVKEYGAGVTYVRKMAPIGYTHSNPHAHTWSKVQNNIY